MDEFTAWVADLEARQLASLRFPEISRALRALSSTYVERRSRLADSPVFAGAGKRAAFALFYGPVHYLIVREIVHRLPGAIDDVPVLVDLGCGTGAAGAAWASSCGRRPRIIGIDKNTWALQEAARTYRSFGLSARTIRGHVVGGRTRVGGGRRRVVGPTFRSGAHQPDAGVRGSAWPRGPATFLAAFVMNELPDKERTEALDQLIARAAAGDRVLVVEPIATSVTPWWRPWQARVEAAGGRADEWRFQVELPPIVQKLDRATGMNHRECTARTLYLS